MLFGVNFLADFHKLWFIFQFDEIKLNDPQYYVYKICKKFVNILKIDIQQGLNQNIC